MPRRRHRCRPRRYRSTSSTWPASCSSRRARWRPTPRRNPKLVSNIAFSQAPAPELPGKIKAQQDAGQRGHRPGADRHRRPVRRHRPEAVDSDRHRLRVGAAGPEGDLPAGRAEDAGSGAEPGRVRGVLPRRADHRIHAGRGEDAAEDSAGAAGLDPRAQEPLHVCAPRQLRPGPHLPAGPALHPEGQGSDGSKRWVGQNLGLSRRAGQEHRILPDRHRCGR